MFMLKRCLMLVFCFAVAAVLAPTTYAFTTDACVIYVTPNVNYQVQIETGTGSSGVLDFGSMILNEVKWSTGSGLTAGDPSSAVVKNIGNAKSDWMVRGYKIGNVVWSLTNRGNTKDTVASDVANLTAILTTTDTDAPAINNASFADADIIDNTVSWVNMDATNYAGNDTGNDVPQPIGANYVGIRSMWFRLKMPSDTSVSSQQQFRVEIKAQTGGTF